MTHILRSGRAPVARVDLRTLRSMAMLGVGTIALVLTYLAMSTAPRPVALGVGVVLTCAAIWFVQPLAGLHFVVLFTLIGDISTMPWYPFTKNFSAKESSLYIGHVFALSPLELTLGVAFLALVCRYLGTGTWPFRAGGAFRPVAAFTAFVLFGFVHGILAGGDMRAAVFEVRAMLVLFPVYILVVSVCRTPAHYRGVLITALIGIELNAVLSLNHILRLPGEDLEAPENLIEHSSALRMNVLLIALIVAMLFRGSSRRMRLLLLAGAVPLLWTYFLSERRAAFVALGVGGVIVFATLHWRQPSTFRKVFPVVAVVLIGYVGAFWNSEGSAAFPAQAVKSVVAPNSLSDRNESSDLYRQIENFDLNYTIKQGKLLGLGFGKPFYRPIQLADISAFEFFLYIPHNSMLALWVKTGFAGFVAAFSLFGLMLMTGARKLRVAPAGDELWVVLTGVTFAAMLPVFAFVDIAWDARDMLLLAFAAAICCDFPVRTIRGPG